MTDVAAFSGRGAAPFDSTGEGNHFGNTSTELANEGARADGVAGVAHDNFRLA